MVDPSDVGESSIKFKEMKISSEEKAEHFSRNLIEIDSSATSNSDTSIESPDNSSEFTFDNVIGHLEDMLIDENFHLLQNGFLEKYWKEFDESDENKHCYMTIFNEYTNKVEEFIVGYLKERVTDFDMDIFASELEHRKNNLDGEIFEVLLTLSDFSAFKEIFLDYRTMKEGHGIDLGESLCVSSVPL